MQSEGRAQWTYKSLLFRESIGLWSVLIVEVMWWLWLARLDAIYGGLREDFGILKGKLLKAGEGYYSKMIVDLKSKIDKLSRKSRSAKESLELESLGRKKELLALADLSVILKLQYL